MSTENAVKKGLFCAILVEIGQEIRVHRTDEWGKEWYCKTGKVFV